MSSFSTSLRSGPRTNCVSMSRGSLAVGRVWPMANGGRSRESRAEANGGRRTATRRWLWQRYGQDDDACTCEMACSCCITSLPLSLPPSLPPSSAVASSRSMSGGVVRLCCLCWQRSQTAPPSAATRVDNPQRSRHATMHTQIHTSVVHSSEYAHAIVRCTRGANVTDESSWHSPPQPQPPSVLVSTSSRRDAAHASISHHCRNHVRWL